MLDSIRNWLDRAGRADPQTPRAPYALPPGVPALQGDPEQARRRMLMGIALVALLAGSAGFAYGRRRQPDGGPPR
jgi:hypothetical protein